MNKLKLEPQEEKAQKNNVKNIFRSKWKDWLLFGGIALVLLIVTYYVFRDKEEEGILTSVQYEQTEAEWKIKRLLEEIDGVGEAEVAVCETEDGVQSVVVVCEGANDLRVIMTVREAVASAVGTQEKSVKIYLKK